MDGFEYFLSSGILMASDFDINPIQANQKGHKTRPRT